MSENQISSEVLIALRQIMRAVDIHSKKLEQSHHLTGPQQTVLNEIARCIDIPIGTLAKAVSLSNATVTGIVDRLEKRGLVTRGRSLNDRRQVLIQATESGLSTLKSAPPSLQQQFTDRFEKLDGAEQQTILRSLERTASMLNAEELEVGPILSGQPLPENDTNSK